MTVKIIHKNSRVEFKNATADQLEYGELALNYNESGPYLQCKGSDDEVVQLGGVFISATAPGNPLPGKWWLNGTTLSVYDGTQWIAIAGGGGGGGPSDPVYDGRLTLQDGDGNTLGSFTANQQGNTTITIPTSDFSGSWNDLTDKPTIGDGKITIEENNGNDLGEFTVNQVGNLIITLPPGASFSGSYNDLTDKPTIGDGNIVISGGSGINASGDNATANQVGDTARVLSVDTTWLGTWIDTNKPAPNVGDGQITLKDADGNPVGQFTVNQASDQDIILPAIPDSLHPKGFINVDDPAPANPEVGDIYIQHKDDVSDGISDASFAPGIPTGTAVEEGTFVMYGADLQWHAGSKSTSTQVQSNWNETNTTEPSFIQNKPDIDGMIDAKVNDGKLTLTNKHNTAKVLEFTANQSANDTVQMPYMPLDIRELQELS